MNTEQFYANECDDLDEKAKEPMWERQHNYLLERIVELADIDEGDKILDIGCGSGRICNIVSNKWIYYTGIDVSPKVIRIAKRKHPQDEFHVCNAKKLSRFDTDSFDIVICSEVLEHLSLDEWGDVLFEIKRVCKNEGTIIFSVPNLYYLWAYVPYHFNPIKRRLTLKDLLVGLDDGMCYENYYTSTGKEAPFHRRIKPSLFKMILDICFHIDKVETTYWYNNRPIHNIWPKMQMKILQFSMLTSGIFGSQVIVRCKNE